MLLPKIIEVDEDKWDAENLGSESNQSIMRDVDARLVATVNAATG